MEEFRNGDFIRLKDMNKYHIDRFSNVNIFKITIIIDGYVEVRDCKDRIPLSEIEPIPINGKDDSQIYYDPIYMAPIVGWNEPSEMRRKDYSYYYDYLQRCLIGNQNYQELIREKGLLYVHEVQHFLYDLCPDNHLRLNDW